MAFWNINTSPIPNISLTKHCLSTESTAVEDSISPGVCHGGFVKPMDTEVEHVHVFG